MRFRIFRELGAGVVQLLTAGEILEHWPGSVVLWREDVSGWVVETSFTGIVAEPDDPPLLYRTVILDPLLGTKVYRNTTRCAARALHDFVVGEISGELSSVEELVR